MPRSRRRKFRKKGTASETSSLPPLPPSPEPTKKQKKTTVKKPLKIWRKKQNIIPMTKDDEYVSENEESSLPPSSASSSSSSIIDGDVSGEDEKTLNHSADELFTDDSPSRLDLFETSTIVLMVAAEEGTVRTAFLKEDIAEIMKIKRKHITINRLANAAFIIQGPEMSVAIGLKKESITKLTDEKQDVFMDEIEQLIAGN